MKGVAATRVVLLVTVFALGACGDQNEPVDVAATASEGLNLTRNPGHGVMTVSAVRGRGATCQRIRLG
jgi:hypothetical protein